MIDDNIWNKASKLANYAVVYESGAVFYFIEFPKKSDFHDLGSHTIVARPQKYSNKPIPENPRI